MEHNRLLLEDSQSARRANQLFEEHQGRIYKQTDKMFAGLLMLEWVACITAAFYFSPSAWIGIDTAPNVHVWAASILGGIIAVLPVALVIKNPGARITRYSIAIAQMLMSGLLIHLTGGRIETHFHVFGSLAFLAFYRDWRVIIIGSAVTAADHILRGMLWPFSIYGVESAEKWRWLEHAGWVVFEDVFLLYSCSLSLKEMHGMSDRDAKLEESNRNLERKVEERTQQVVHLAYHDALTNLPNRRLFQDRLDQALSFSRRHEKAVAVLYLDVDNFKRVNDTYGHQAGDRLLTEVASRLNHCIRDEDTLARMGGDEFTILLNGLSRPEQAREFAERALTQLSAPIVLTEGLVYIGGSIGIAYSENGEQSDILMRDADTAMYHAKTIGKGTFAFYNDSMNAHFREHADIETGLRKAIERDEFRVFYQPVLDLNTGRLSGVEALVRWEHPEQGIVAPSKFIPVAEDVGLICPIGYWVLDTACAQLRSWLDKYPDSADLIVNVNLSGRQLQQADVVERVSEALERSGLLAAHLKLEITESVFLGDETNIVGKLRELKALGVKLAIDDFGTGYSSMSKLSEFPVDTVKIDRAFVDRLSEEQGIAMVAAIISLAKAMQLDVTSEGVETAEQVAQLQGLGCDTAQGYYFARPMPGLEMEVRLENDWSQFISDAFGIPADCLSDMLDEITRWNNEEGRKAA